MHVSLPLVIGLASGFASFNVLLAFTCLCLRRRRNKTKRRQEAIANTEKRPSILKQTPPSKHLPSNPLFPRTASGSKTGSSDEASPRSVGLRNQLVVPTRVSREASGDASDTASMYSTASAPIDLHDQILLSQPFSRALNNTYMSPPATVPPRSSKDTASMETVYPVHRSAPPPTIDSTQLFVDQLAPETYDKTFPLRWRGSVLLDTPTRPRASLQSGDLPRYQGTASYTAPDTFNGLRPLYLHLPLISRSISARRLPSPYSPPPL
ncbi:hypothetical protein BDZ97DRAFT_1779741 [Flammula alnicola]|nr:hypothetical protein BDZ97DRAFT_1779741 [Flammula alnicola]